MADNVTITSGAGTTIGADEVTDGTLGTVKVQYVKLMDASLNGTSKAVVGSNGALTVAVLAPTASTVAAITSTTTNGTALQAANTSRAGLYIFNDSTAVLYVKFGTGATPTDWTIRLAAGGFYELPAPYYRGAVSGVWAAANGQARITEIS
jgi:hypothetical protein